MSTEKVHEGTYGEDYHVGRQTKRALKYRLARRADEASRLLRRTAGERRWRILDLGTADGLMLKRMLQMIEASFVVGLDLSPELLAFVDDPAIRPALANGLMLPFAPSSFDLVVATAVIEHASDPAEMLAECARVLVPGGFCVVTTPDPFWERIATGVGHLPDEGHNETMNLARLRTYVDGAGFEVLSAYKFMMSPWGFPAELVIEKVIRGLGLSFVLLNQIVVARRPER